MITTSSNADTIAAQLFLTPREVAKATARGINRATKVGWLAAREQIPRAFPGAKPRALPWMRALTIRKPNATPERLESGVTVGALNFQLRSPWMLLTTFEDGGTQKARDNVPTLGWKVAKKPAGVDTRQGLKPKALGLAYRLDANPTPYLAVGRGSLGGAARGNRPRTGRGRVYGAKRTFLINTRAGIPAIMQRTGKDSIRALWWLVPSQPVRRIPWFRRTSEQAAGAVLDTYVSEEISKQLDYAFQRVIGGGAFG